MERIFEQMTSWIKDWLVDALMDIMTGMFDSINSQVADVAGHVITSSGNIWK